MVMKKLLLLLGCISLAGCLDVSAPADNPSDPTTETFAPSLGVNLAQMTKVPVGDQFVYYKDISVGSGAQLDTITQTTIVVIDYGGFLPNGSNFTGGEQQQQSIPLPSTIVGLQAGMLGMSVGGERLIVIPSALGYGAFPPTGSGIPANSTLVFDVILDDFQ